MVITTCGDVRTTDSTSKKYERDTTEFLNYLNAPPIKNKLYVIIKKKTYIYI